MPQRGQVYRPVVNVNIVTGETHEDTIWVPFLAGEEPVIVPDVFMGDGPRVRSLMTVKAYGVDHICEQYAYITSYRVETSRKSFVLGPEDVLDDVIAQVGGRSVFLMEVMQLVGDLIYTDAGPAYETTPCFRIRIPLDERHRPPGPPANAIGFVLYHPDKRAELLDDDWLPHDPATSYATVPPIEVRLDRAEAGSGDNLYAPELNRSGEMVGVTVMSRRVRASPTPSSVVTTKRPHTDVPAAEHPPITSTAITILPEAPRRRRFIGNR